MNLSNVIIVPKMTKYELDLHNLGLTHDELMDRYEKEGTDKDRVMEGLEPGELYENYRPVQKTIVCDINKRFGLRIRPSDALLLAHMTEQDARELTDEQMEMVKPFKRGDGFRFCLTPSYHKKEKEGK